MKLFKHTAAVLLSAVLTAAAALTAYAAPVDAGDPTGAGLLITQNDPADTPQSGTGGSDPTGADPTADRDSPPGSTGIHTPTNSDKVYEPININGWRWWTGSSELKEEYNYFTDDEVRVQGDVILPKGSSMLLGEGTRLYLHSDASFIIKGTLIISPNAEIISSGILSIADSGTVENYGKAKFMRNSTINISSDLYSYSGSETAFAGTTLVYGDGQINNFGSMFVPEYANMTITGKLHNKSSGMLYVGGNITTTVNGVMELDGYVDLQERARILNSGVVTLCPDVKYYTNEKARFTNTKSGRLSDLRGSEPTKTPKPILSADELKKGVKGIDVSVWQGAIDWQKVAQSGVKFAIIRSSSGPRVDKLFDYNITEASNAGIYVGVYHYCYAMTPEEAREEARHFINTIKPYKIDFPVMFDFEDNSQAKLGKEKLTAIAEAFLSEVKAAGYYPMIYSYRNWLELNLDMDKLAEYEVALAEWNVETPKYKRPYGIWQYSCKGKISGIEGDVDLDLCFKDYAKLIKEGGYNHLSDFE